MAKKKPKEPEYTRTALVPGLAGAIAMLIGMAMYTSDWYITVLFVVSILACIMAVYSWQSEQKIKFVFIVLYVAIAVYWNPIFRLTDGIQEGIQWWMLLQTGAAVIFFLGAIVLKTPSTTR